MKNILIFENASIWRPDSITLLNKIERVQVKAVKWIVSEQCTTYSCNDYFKRCKELDMLPLKHRLDYFAILLFHKIIYKQVAIEFPSYITLISQTTLRTSHKDQLSYESSVKPRIIKKHYQRKINLTKLTLKTTIKLVNHIKNHPLKSYLIN